MKRIITYFAVFAALLAVSCNRIESSESSGEAGLVRFVLKTSEMETRALTTDDADFDNNEKLVKRVDYFFFKKSDGTDLVEHSYKEFEENQNPILEFDTEDEYPDLRKPFYAYFLVNYYTTRTEGEGDEAHEVVEYIDHNRNDWTLDALLALPVSTNFLPKEEGVEVPVPDFVMDSMDPEGNLTYVKAESQGAPVTKDIYLYHVAAKLILNFTVANSVNALGDTWHPVTDQMTVRYWNALNSTNVEGAPAERTDALKKAYFNYPEEAPTKSGTTFSSRIYYTYPQLFGTKDEDGKITYSNGEPYFKVFLPWNGEHLGATRFFYKILIKNMEKIERNKYYILNLTIDQLGGVEDEYVLVTDHYYVADWQNPGAMAQAGVTESVFLDIALPEYQFYGIDEMTVPVIASHPIGITINSATKEVFKAGASTQVNQDTGYPKTEENKSFTLKHTLVTDVTKSNYDCGVITYNVTVRLLDHPEYTKNVMVTQYPSVYVKEFLSNGSVFVNGQSYSNPGGNNHYVYNNNHDQIGTIVNPNSIDGDGDNVNPHQYNVYVSVLPEGYPAIIGDPRVGGTAVANLGFSSFNSWDYSYYYQRYIADATVDNTVSSKYKSTGESTQNVIAPAIKIASSFGKTYPMTYERAKERCAAYQENGYPAGRWRLPTVSEIDFLIKLSENNHIPTLFDPGQENTYYAEYWAGGGWAYVGKTSFMGASVPAYDFSSEGSKVQDGKTYSVSFGTGNYANYYYVTYNNNTYNNQVWTRCVYDVWYWGEDNDSQHLSTWGGYQMD